MARIVPDSPDAKRIDAALADWRQGDVALGKRGFTYIGNPDQALTADSAEAAESRIKRLLRRCLTALRLKSGRSPAENNLQAVTADVDGLVVVTQTCDIVRSCTARPFVEVAPLVSVSKDILQDIKKGWRPAYAHVPGLAEDWLVADLDRIMTVEKSVVAAWERTPGCRTDQQAREFANALARKRVRFAFPDDFSALVQKLQNRLQDKHGKNSDEGRALRALKEIRVRAAPSWDDETVEITFWFLRNEQTPDFEGKTWYEHLASWLKLVPASGRFKSVDGLVTTLDDLTARDYVESDRLDLDHLSVPAGDDPDD